MKTPTATLLIAAVLIAAPGRAQAQSAMGQLINAAGGGGVSVPPASSPTCIGNCGSGSVSRGAASGSSGSYGYNPSVDIGSAILGSLLSSVLFAPDQPKGPSPEELRQQQLARQQAEAAAKKRAAEEQARQQRLLASLKSVPLPKHYAAQPGTQGTTEIPLKALASLEAPAQSAQTPGDDLEALRAKASLGFDTAAAADMRFAIRFRPMPLSTTPVQPVYHPFCENQQCRWPTEPGAKLPKVVADSGSKAALSQSDVVKLLRSPTAKGSDAGTAIINGIMASSADASADEGRYVIDERLKRFSIGAVKTLAEAWFWMYVAKVFEDEKTLQQGIDLMHKVYSLSNQDMQDAIKSAQWLGSDRTDGAPQVTSVGEASLPFIQSALDASGVFGEQATSAVSTGIDVYGLASGMKSLWEKGG